MTIGGDQSEATNVRNEKPTRAEKERALMGMLIWAVTVFFVASIPLLGAYASHSKGRGIVEGYALSTFFCCFGLVVVLCLPNIRRRKST